MSETKVRRRGFGEDGIYLDAARNRYMGAISLGYGPDGKRIRRKVSGKTRQEVRAKLQALHQEMNAGVRSSSTYAVREAVDDWLREGLEGTSDRTRTLYAGLPWKASPCSPDTSVRQPSRSVVDEQHGWVAVLAPPGGRYLVRGAAFHLPGEGVGGAAQFGETHRGSIRT
jgi:hypothetical protein